MDLLMFVKKNRERIQAVENSFGKSSAPLAKEGRVLIGQGRLVKQGRRKRQIKGFFLFNDVLMYGGILLNSWHKNQKILPLEDLKLEDMEDGVVMNQWLIRTRRKSFYVSASSPEEKQAWIEHIEQCRSNLLQDGGCRPLDTYASTWIPDRLAFKCMRCFKKFTTTKRRHHCRKCGFLVCNSCSKQRVVLGHIHPTKKQRVCSLCHTRDNEDEDEVPHKRNGSIGKSSSEEDCVTASSDEDAAEDIQLDCTQSGWLDSQIGHYVYPIPMHLRP